MLGPDCVLLSRNALSTLLKAHAAITTPLEAYFTWEHPCCVHSSPCAPLPGCVLDVHLTDTYLCYHKQTHLCWQSH